VSGLAAVAGDADTAAAAVVAVLTTALSGKGHNGVCVVVFCVLFVSVLF
jgi:hypothetical protein